MIPRKSPRLGGRVQLTSDGHKAYLEAVEEAFGNDVDYAVLQKLYGTAPEAQTRYSPARCIGIRSEEITGNPDPKHISTSFCRAAKSERGIDLISGLPQWQREMKRAAPAAARGGSR